MLYVLIGLAIVAVLLLSMTLKIVRQQHVGIVERLGKYRRKLEPGPHLVIPIFDKIVHDLDVREEVVPFPPQGVITEDNLMVSIDSVIYFQIVDPVRAAYEAQDYRGAIEQLTMTTLRNIIGGMDLETALTSRDEINQKLRMVLDEATGKWGIKVNRVELRAIDPPATIRDAMEKGARAERDKRATILLAEGQRQSQILSAGGDRESAILRAQGAREAAVLSAQADRQAQMLRSEGEAQAITTVFNAIHAGQPDQALLAYQYMQMLPSLAKGDSNKMWIIPSELNDALKGLGQVAGAGMSGGEATREYGDKSRGDFQAPPKIDVQAEIQEQTEKDAARSQATVQKAIDEAQALDNPGIGKRAGGRRSAPLGASGAVPAIEQTSTSPVSDQQQDAGDHSQPGAPSPESPWGQPQQN